MGSGAKSYMRKGFLICEKMRKYFTIYYSYMTLHPIPLNFLIHEENFLFCIRNTNSNNEEAFLPGAVGRDRNGSGWILLACTHKAVS
jgi:hypothetical protein